MFVRTKGCSKHSKDTSTNYFARARFVYWRLIMLSHQRIAADILLFKSMRTMKKICYLRIKCMKLKQDNDCAQNSSNNRVGLKPQTPGHATALKCCVSYFRTQSPQKSSFKETFIETFCVLLLLCVIHNKLFSLS